MSKRKRRDEEPEAGPSQKTLRASAANENDRSQENDLETSQQPDFQYTATMGDEGEVGLIEAVKLKNFMCHEKLDVKFGPHCNFLIGRNGSGKSAILTGIVVGLGGKANITNRGSSIKGFIKSNKNVAEVQVTLRNRGTDAFKPDLYGKSITVCRKLSDGGGGGYKLLSADGRVMSVKKEELDHILDQFNIQVDNPVAILNQDTSRNFLHSKNAHDKYMFFLKATQLEQMKHDYVRANESKEIAVGILNDKQGTLPGLEQEVFEWEQKYKALASLDELRKKVQKLKDEMAWALISEKEKGLEPISKSLKLEEARTPKFLQKVSETADKVKECMERKKEAEQQLKATSKEVEVLEPQHSKLKKSWDEKKKTYRSAQMAYRKVRSELESNKKERTEILKRIEDLKNSSQQDYQGERQRREKKIALLEEKVEAIKAQQHVTEHSVEQFRAAVTRSKEQQYNLKAEETDCKTRMDQVKRELHNLEQSKTNKMRRYGAWMPDLLRKIDQAANQGVFHKKPLGPIGAFITARDPKWALAIEVCLKGLIHAFCVHDHHDEKILENLFNQACPDGKKPSTITCPFYDEVYNVSRNAPGRDKRWTTIMNELEVNNPVVMNTLIDQRTIECVLLFHDKEEGRKIMIKEKPRNVREGFDANGDQLFCHPTFRYYSNTSIAKANFLSASVEENIRNLKEELPRFEAEKAQIHDRVQGLDFEIRKNTSEQRKCETQLTKIRNQMGIHSMEIAELKNVEDPAPVDVTTLEEEIENYDRQIKQLQDKHDSTLKDNEKEKANVDAVERELKDIDKKIKHAIDQSEPVKELLASIDNEIEIAKSHEAHYKAKMKEHEKKIQELRQQHNDYKKELEESISKAEQICPRMRTRRTAQNLESEINQINKRIRTEEKNRGNHEEITRKYHETFTKFKKIKKEVQQLTNFLKKLDSTMEVRQLWYIKKRASLTMRMKQFFIVHLSNRKFNGKLLVNHKEGSLYPVALEAVMDQRQRQFFEFRRMIALRAKYFFIVMLANRHYTGKISFNHQNETLTLSVQPTMVNGEGAKDMKALSGGERSFATVCFILSLWDAMESPFRCLDEFDVFMDMVNRRISMDMMLDVAGKQKGRQFIFLTPQDMSSLAHRKNVRIFELRPPERGQSTINFPSANRRNQDEDEEDGN